jgi:hypothetical protein
MWVGRFKEYLLTALAEAGHPGIDSVEWWAGPDPDMRNIKVNCTDGRAIYLTIVGSSRPGGEDHTKPEVIVTKDSLETSAS